MKLGKYLHSKSGKEYEVIGFGKYSETNEDVVIYKALYKNPLSEIWVRPLEMFEEEVQVNGKKVPRFQFLGN